MEDLFVLCSSVFYKKMPTRTQKAIAIGRLTDYERDFFGHELLEWRQILEKSCSLLCGQICPKKPNKRQR